jgi:hypothetical protein
VLTVERNHLLNKKGRVPTVSIKAGKEKEILLATRIKGKKGNLADSAQNAETNVSDLSFLGATPALIK